MLGRFFLLGTFVFSVFSGVSFAGDFIQRMPACESLNQLWVTRFQPLLKLDIPNQSLDCQLTSQDPYAKIRLALARGAFLMDSTIFHSGPFLVYPLFMESPPASMLEWVAKRVRGKILIVTDQDFPSADLNRGNIHFPLSLENEDAIEIAGQLIHEARHLGIPPILHSNCDSGLEAACDNHLTDYFNSANAGPHAIAALWLSWIAKRSYWEPAIKSRAEAVVLWIVSRRINGPEMIRQKWLRKYLADSLSFFRQERPLLLRRNSLIENVLTPKSPSCIYEAN